MELRATGTGALPYTLCVAQQHCEMKRGCIECNDIGAFPTEMGSITGLLGTILAPFPLPAEKRSLLWGKRGTIPLGSTPQSTTGSHGLTLVQCRHHNCKRQRSHLGRFVCSSLPSSFTDSTLQQVGAETASCCPPSGTHGFTTQQHPVQCQIYTARALIYTSILSPLAH